MGAGNEFNRTPGLSTKVTATPRRLLFVDLGNIGEVQIIVSSAARDSGNTPTTLLREGLVMGRLTADEKFTNYDNSASDGSETARGLLRTENQAGLNLLDDTGTAIDKTARLLVSGGLVDQDQCIGLNDAARAELAHIQWKDDVYAA